LQAGSQQDAAHGRLSLYLDFVRQLSRFGGFETGVENCCQGARYWHDTWGTAALQAGSQQDAAHMEECHINQGFRRGVRQLSCFAKL